jgi:hypothetical protein
MKKVSTILPVAIATAAFAAPAFAAGGRTMVLAEDRDTSEYAFMFAFASGQAINVRALTLRSVGTTSVKAKVEVECKLGESKASRTVNFRLGTGLASKPLPVPVRGGICRVGLDVTANEPGQFSVSVQAR